MKTFKISLTAAQAATFLRSQLGSEGIDVIEHFINIIGSTNEIMLDKLFGSVDPNWNPFPEFKVGQNVSLRRYCKNLELKIVEVDFFKEEILFNNGTKEEISRVKAQIRDFEAESATENS